MNRKSQTVVILITLIITSLACGISGSSTQAPPITQVIQVTQIVPVTQAPPITQVVPVTQIVPAVSQQEAEVYANKSWQDTGIEVRQGEIVTIRYVSGQWSPFSGYYTDGQGCTDPNFCTQDLSILANWPDNIVGGIHATLIARIGNGQIIVVGNEITFEAKDTGILLLRINDKNISDNSGSLTILVKIKP